ncbi:MAG: hypothetical protein ACRC1K_24995, partial [Planctomycetia bacterium]
MSFDPYRDWLGIPPDEQPPTLYRLLGVADFVDDPAAIHKATLLRTQTLRRHQAGKHSDESQRLLNEVSAARVLLLDPTRKAEYDLKLNLERNVYVPSADDPAVPGVSGAKANRAAGMAVAAFLTLAVLTGGTAVLVWVKSTDPVVAPAPTDVPVVEALAPPPAKTEPAKDAPPKDAVAALPAMVAPAVGKELLWSTNFADEAAAVGLCRVGFPRGRLNTQADGTGLRALLDPGDRRDLLLPVPAGDFRFLVRVRQWALGAPRQLLWVGAFQNSEQFLAVELRPTVDAAGKTAGPTALLRRLGPDAVAKAPATVGAVVGSTACWVALERTGGRWSAGVSSDGKTFRPTPIDAVGPSAGPAPLDDPAVAVGLRFENPTDRGYNVGVDVLRLEGNDPTFAARLSGWPKDPPLPTGERLAELFGGDFTMPSGEAAQLRYQFLSDAELATWGARRTADGLAAQLRPRGAFAPGPIHRLRRLEAEVRFPDATTALEIRFTDGGSIVLDPAARKIHLRPTASTAAAPVGKSIDAPIAPGRKHSFAVGLQPGGRLAAIFDGAEAVWPDAVGFNGEPSVHVVGVGSVDLFSFQAFGRFDPLALWLPALGGARNALSRPDARPDDVRVMREPAKAAVVAGWTELRKAPTVVPLTLEPGRPARLEFVNTAADETHPLPTADGLELYYTEAGRGNPAAGDLGAPVTVKAKGAQGDGLRVARRGKPSEQFSAVGELVGLPENPTIEGAALSADGRSLTFSMRSLEENLDLFTATRPDPARAFTTVQPLLAARSENDEQHPFQTADGRQVYFSRFETDAYRQYVVTRDGPVQPFGDAKPVAVKPGLHHATLTEDRKTMYLQGDTKSG